jgi:putative peptidoglycan lipid II flippase
MPNVARAGGIMMLSLLLSRVLGLVRDAVIAGQFGSNDFTDAYRLAFQVPDLLFFLIAGGALSSAFIPVFSEYLHTEREDEAWHIFSVVTTIMSILVFAFIGIAWIFADKLVLLTSPGLMERQVKLLTHEQMLDLVNHMSRIVLPSQFAFFIGGLMFGTLYARQIFTVPGLGPNIYNIGIIAGAFLGPIFLTGFFGVVGMSWGALFGALAGNLLIPYWAMKKIGLRFNPSLDYRHPGVKKVFKLMLPVVLGLSLPGVYALIMQAFGSYYPAGVNTYLEFSNKLMQAPLGVFGQSLAIGVFPALAQFYAQEKMDMFRNQLSSTLRTVIYLTLPCSVLMAIMAPQIVAALLQHGNFTAANTLPTAAALRWFSIGITAWCMHPVLMRGFFAAHVTVKPIVLGTLTTALFFCLVSVLWNTAPALGFLTLPFSSSASAIFLVVILLIAVAKTVGGIDYKGIGQTLGKSLLSSIPLALVLSPVLIPSVGEYTLHSKVAALACVFILSLVGAWAYYFASRALQMPESSTISRALDRVTKRRR